MKNVRPVFLIQFFLVGLVRYSAAHASLDYPKGGETFMPGQTITITWSNEILHDPVNWDLYFSSDGGTTWQDVSVDMPFDQFMYQWTVPNTETSQGVFRIVQDNMTVDYDDKNNPFFSISNDPVDPDPGVVTSAGESLGFVEGLTLSNYPNPFSISAHIAYSVPHDSQVTVIVCDFQGNNIATLVDRKLLRGKYTTSWNPSGFTNGLFLIRLRAGKSFITRKLLLIR